MIDPARLAQAMDEIRERVADAAQRAGRQDEVQIILAGKYVPTDEAQALVDAGVRSVGENRLQDLEAKRAIVGDAVTFDFIGHLQRRKVPAVLAATRLIHAVDSERLAGEIDLRAAAPTRVLAEVNLTAEPTKYGIHPDQLDAFVEAITPLGNVVLGGLMTLPPPTIDPERSRPHFDRMRRLRDDMAVRWGGRHDFRELSMGTSQDFAVAVEEGATMVRIGRSVIDRSQVN